MYEHGHGDSRQRQIRPRKKTGLETPLKGRFSKENRRLIFAPPQWYDTLVICCFLVGASMFLLGPFFAFFGSLFFASGVWAVLSNERITFNLTERSYVRLEGQSVLKHRVQGQIAELDALVLLAEEIPLTLIGQRSVVYRLVLHWKGGAHPLLVLERESHTVLSSAPLNSADQAICHRGQQYARALGLTFYDNSYFSSPAPLPMA